MAGSGDVGGDFAHPEIIGQKLFCILDNLASCNNSAGDILKTVESAVGQKLIDGLAELSEITCSALAAYSAAADAS